MRLAILGATSQIAKDLVRSIEAQNSYELVLYARRPDVVSQWLTSIQLEGRHTVADFVGFTTDEYFDAIFNFVGVGDPAQAAAMGPTIFDVTHRYDELALNYLRHHPDCRYIFLSSGAAYGSSFDVPADENTKALININNLLPQDWYGVAKLYAESRHRTLTNLPIVDIRVFNYFSRTQNMDARYFITDTVRALRGNAVLRTSSEYMVRDYLHPSDFYRLIDGVLKSPPINLAVDCYSKAPIEKTELLEVIKKRFGLRFEADMASASINATGNKSSYYSLSRRAEWFGYNPCMTSLEGVCLELENIISGSEN